MFAELAMAVQIMATRPDHTAAQPYSLVMDAHQWHLAHERHLLYLAWRHAEHMAEERSDRTPSPHVAVSAAHYSTHVSPGIFTCAGLESLWRDAGGSSYSAFLAAEIAMAESGGRSWAISPTNDYGLWQINGSHGYLATLDPYGNARAAVLISQDGTDWYPWTTYVTGAYIGRCLPRIASNPCDLTPCRDLML